MRRCIDENEAMALLRGAFDEAATEAIDAHVDGCPECLDVLSSLSRLEGAERRADEPPIRLGRGATLGRYVLLELAGVGGMGVVYAAYDPELDRKVALKLIVSDRGPAAETDIVQEARAMAQLRHPNVVTVHDLGSFDAGVFFAMELIVGTTLTEWCRGENRSPDQVLAAFIEAGRGLEAAHRAGIVHRDFKPDNVLVDESVEGQRRIAVTDFGLATAHGVAAVTIAGTPHYMAPEQRDGGRGSDARADQYAFCVALRDALVGTRPADGVTPSTRGIPRVRPRIARAIARGLADAPDDRWPSMTALLAELAQPARGGWRRVALGATAVLSLLLIFAAIFRVRIEQRVDCERRTRTIDRLWSSAEKDALRRGILGVATSFAAEEWSRVERVLDRHVATAHAASVELCRSQPSSELFALRATCLDTDVDQLREYMQLFEHPDAEMVRRATTSAYLLGRLEQCSDIQSLIHHAPSRADRETARALALARMLATTGKPLEAARLTEEAAKATEARGDRRSAAAVFGYWADLSSSMGDVEAAGEHALHAERLAESAGADRTRASALVSQMWISGYHHLDLRRTLELDARARLVLERIGGDDSIETFRLTALAVTQSNVGNDEAALPLNMRSVDLMTRVYGRRTGEVASGLTNVGMSATGVGDFRLARESLMEAISIFTEVYGPDFARLAIALENLGALDVDEGRLAEARANYQRALAITEKVRDPNHPAAASILDGMGDLDLRRGKPSEAIPVLLRAISILERTYGKGHKQTQESLQLLGLAYVAVGDRDRAVEALSQAETLGEEGEPVLQSRAKLALARALWETKTVGSRERSMALAVRALELAKRTKKRDGETEKTQKEIATWIQHHEKRAAR